MCVLFRPMQRLHAVKIHVETYFLVHRHVLVYLLTQNV